jgi:hypothetical protein
MYENGELYEARIKLEKREMKISTSKQKGKEINYSRKFRNKTKEPI